MDELEFRDRVIKILEDISVKLGRLETKLARPETPLESRVEREMPLDVYRLLDLKGHLQRTAKAVIAKGPISAEDVAKLTHRTRAAESDYLNQLVDINYISRKRKGRTVYFYVQSEKNLE